MIWHVVAAKDLRLILRDRAALLFLMLVPIVVVTVIAEALAGSDVGTLVLPVVNEDQGPVAEVLLESLESRADVVEVDRKEAMQLVVGDKIAPAALVIPRKTSKRYLGNLPSTLTLLTDPARAAELRAIQAYLLLAEREAEEIADPFAEPLLVLEQQNVTGSRQSVPPAEQAVPGFSLMFVFMGVLFGVAYGLRDEQDWGVVPRLYAAPVPRSALLAGKLVARFAIGCLQLALLLAYGYLAFDMAIGTSLAALAAVVLASVFSMTGVSLLVAAVARSREQIIPLGLAVVMVLCAVGGCWWPLYQVPTWLQAAANATFTAWAMEGIHDVILRDRGIGDVLLGVGVLLAYGLVSLGLGLRLYRFDLQPN